MKIVSKKIVGDKNGFHTVIATLENGKSVEFHNCANGQSLYPDEFATVHYFDAAHNEGGIQIFPAGSACIVGRDGEFTHVAGMPV